MTGQQLLRTPLYDSHVTLDARMVPFSGFSMPVQYDSILKEVRAVRTAVGMFDVSHMGRFLISGTDSQPLLNWVHTADISDQMPINRARYGLICDETGGIIDDAIIYRIENQLWMLVANAGNRKTILDWLQRCRNELFPNAEINDSSSHLAMIALQGPTAKYVISNISDIGPDEIRPFNIVNGVLAGQHQALIARTGYTGEDGVEIMPHSSDAPRLWKVLLDQGVVPCGLGARDVLRLEAGLPLHGSDIDLGTNPVHAGLTRFVSSKAPHCGYQAIASALTNGINRVLVGFKTMNRGAVPRSHAPILSEGESIGSVTSGSYSPTLDMNIGLGYVPPELADLETKLTIDVRGKLIDAIVVQLPFYSRLR